MRQLPLISSLTLLSAVISGSILLADTPVRPMQASFPSKSSAAKPTTAPATTVVQPDKLQQVGYEQPALPEPKVIIDYPVKAATIEVAWLQDFVTYPYHLRAEHKPGEETITLSGFVPSEKLREKALFLARMTVGNLNLIDQMIVHNQMALPQDVPVDANQTQTVLECIEKSAPGMSKMLQVTVDPSGITTVYGRVDQFADRLKIIRALQGIPGCTAIRYDLRVYVPPVQQVQATVPMVSVPMATVPMVSIPTITPASNNVPLVAPPLKLSFTPSKVPINTTLPTMPDTPKASVQESAPKEPPSKKVSTEKRPPAKPITASATQIIQAGCVEPLNQPIENIVVANSVSGLFPPGMSGRSTEPAITLGSPVIVKASFDINLDVMNTNEPPRTRDVDLIKSSTSSATVPVSSASQDPAPVPIGIMPRLAK